MKNIFQKTALAVSVSFFLISCGGGGSSDPEDQVDTVSFTSATVQGKAAKGIIIGGLVQADELNADGSVKTANVGSATTDNAGKYSLTLGTNYAEGPIEVTVSAGANTVMVCDATTGCGNFSTPLSTGESDVNANDVIDFGDRYKPSSLNMTAMLPMAANNATIDVQITPFTHMAAQRARTQASGTGGSLSAATIESANSAVSTMLGGVNILRTEPVDITDPASISDADATAVSYAALSAAVAEMAAPGSNGDIDITQVLSDLSSDFNDGSISSDTLGNLVEGAGAALALTSTADISGVLNQINQTVAAASGGDVTPTPNPNAGNTDVEKAYAFTKDLRTWGTVINAEIASPSQAFQSQIDLTDQIYTLVDNSFDTAISAAVEAMGNLVDGTNTESNLALHTVLGGSFTTGTLTKTEDSAGYDVYTVSNASFTPDIDTNNVATLDMVLHLPRDKTEISGSVTWGIQSLSAEDSYASLTATQGLITVTLGEAYTPDFNANNAPSPVINSVSVDMTIELTELKTISGTTLVDDPYPVTYSGDIAFTLYTYLDANTHEPVGAVPGALTFNGSVANTKGDQIDADISASISGANLLQPSNSVIDIGTTYASANDLNGDSVVDLNEHLVYWDWIDTNRIIVSTPYIYLDAIWNQNGSVDQSYSYTYSDGTTSSGTYTYPGPYANIQEFAANNFTPDDFSGSYIYVDGQGYYSTMSSSSPIDYSVDGYIEFTMQEPDVDYNLDNEEINLGLQFTVQLSGMPEARVSITGTQTELDKGNAAVTISYGIRSLSLTSAVQPSSTDPLFNVATGSMTITNLDGVELVLSYDLEGADAGDIISGTMTIGGVSIGTLSNTDYGLKLSYIDGTFEIL